MAKLINIRLVAIILSLLFVYLIIANAKHNHRSRGSFSCNFPRKCSSSAHKGHKICGSDGKLYQSHCHLRKASCSTGVPLKAVHPDRCEDDDNEDSDDEGLIEGKTLLDDVDQRLEESLATKEKSLKHINDEPDVENRRLPDKKFNQGLTNDDDGDEDDDDNNDDGDDQDNDNGSFGSDEEQKKRNRLRDGSTEDGDDNDSDEDQDVNECDPQEYDLMKEQLLFANSDIATLFSSIDVNGDGYLDIGELWSKSNVYKTPDGKCLITDLMMHEDANDDQRIDFTELQIGLSKLYTISMVTLDERLAVNPVTAHIGDNVEIRCDIMGRPQPPAIKWMRFGVDLATSPIPNVKVFNDGSLYLTNVQLSFSGNFTCIAKSNPQVKQIHVLHVIVPPIVELQPHFQWSPVGGQASYECMYESLGDTIEVQWLKNDEALSAEQLESSSRIAIRDNGTRLSLSRLTRSDTGAFACHVINRDDGSFGEDVGSLLVQDEPVGIKSEKDLNGASEKLWVFHANGLSIYSDVCGQVLHEIDARDVIPMNGLQLCGGPSSATAPTSSSVSSCEWSHNVVHVGNKIFVGQPNLNRIVVFHSQQLNVVDVIPTDANPRRLFHVHGSNFEDQIWILNEGTESAATGSNPSVSISTKYFESSDSMEEEHHNQINWAGVKRTPTSSRGFKSSRAIRNRKSIQVIRNANTGHLHNIIHLQPIDGHFDLVNDLFMAAPSFGSNIASERLGYTHNQFAHQYAYANHWDERDLIKIDIHQLKYLKTINLADCWPRAAMITSIGLIIIQCQTPVTHHLTGQLVMDSMTDATIAFNSDTRADEMYLSPNQRYLVNIQRTWSNSTDAPSASTTIIVQRIRRSGLEFMYDVRTSLNIVNCEFVWKNGDYNAVLASGTPNREDLLYLSLADGRVELISGIGRPTNGHRGIAVAKRSRLVAITSVESVFIVDLETNRLECETHQLHQKPTTLIWA